MKREDKIAKLKSIRICITNLTATYDMGLEFTIITSNGGDVNIGNIGNWPIGTINITSGLITLKNKISKGQCITVKDIEETESLKFLLYYNSTPWSESRMVDDNILSNIINELNSQLPKLKLTGKKLFVYSTLESWDNELKFFESKESLEDFILQQWGGSVIPYDNMNDEQLDYYFYSAEDEQFANTFPCFSSNDDEDDV